MTSKTLEVTLPPTPALRPHTALQPYLLVRDSIPVRIRVTSISDAVPVHVLLPRIGHRHTVVLGSGDTGVRRVSIWLTTRASRSRPPGHAHLTTLAL